MKASRTVTNGPIPCKTARNITEGDKLTFAEWWDATGSGMRPLMAADFESHAHRISEAAWIACRAEYLSRMEAKIMNERRAK
jgi:hypothetical protein